MSYKVVITEQAKRQLDMYVGYTAEILKNKQAAKAILADASGTKKRLSFVAEKLALCDNDVLRQHGYRRIMFKKHDFFMVYRLDGKNAVVDAMYHVLQDYEGIFGAKLNIEP